MFTDGEIEIDWGIKSSTRLILLRFPPSDLLTLNEIGMPRDQTPCRYAVFAGDEFGIPYKDFVIEFTGTIGTWPQGQPASIRQVTPRWTVYGNHPPKNPLNGGLILRYPLRDGGTRVINVWRLRVIFMDHSYTTPYLEQLWIAPEAKWLIVMRNILPPHEPRVLSSIKQLADALPLLVLSLGHKMISGYTEQKIEGMINDTIEKMVQAELDKSHPKKFTVTRFVKNWPIATSRSNIYNYINKERFARNGEIENKYMLRCREIAKPK